MNADDLESLRRERHLAQLIAAGELTPTEAEAELEKLRATAGPSAREQMAELSLVDEENGR